MDDYDALSQKQLASLKRDTRISLEDAAVRAVPDLLPRAGLARRAAGRHQVELVGAR